MLVHRAQARELGIGEKDVGISGGGGSGPEVVHLVNILIDGEIDRAVKPKLARRLGGLGGEGTDEEEQGEEAFHMGVYRCAVVAL
jgi:hypothetical protein